MTDAEIRKIVCDKVDRYMEIFEGLSLDTKFVIKRPEVQFTLTGTSAGICRFQQSTGVGHLDFNMVLLRENLDEFMTNIVPHEVAHYCTDLWKGMLFDRGGRCIHHGNDWKQMMRFFGVVPQTTHKMDVTNVKRKRNYRLFEYKCSCQTHQVTSIIHNKMKKGKKYVCTSCKCNLEFVKEIKKK